MKHLGDITKISGHTAPIVDVVIGGSPCQDLSIAGKRAGLDGERSGLFMEQIRIVKEMRDEDERNGRTGVNVRPRYMVWENVPGAFSSNKGDDFRVVLEEIAKVKDKNAVIPMSTDGKWTTCGYIMGNGWSIAWRVLDAQFWGVPQRRRRIALVADFGGQSASEILFVRKGVSGDTDEGKQKRKETSSDASRGTGADDCIGFDGYNGVLTGSKTSTLGVNCGFTTGRNGVLCFEGGLAGRVGGHIYKEKCGSLRANAGDNHPSVAYTLKIRSGVSVDSHGKAAGKGALIQKNLSATLGVSQDQYLFQPVLALDRASFNQGKNSLFDFEVNDKGITPPIVAKGPGAVCYANHRYIVRRLTPMECERLQGYPDGWTDIGEWTDTNGKKHKTSDAARYKALGNSIALPPWKWVLKRICACYERDATMSSLFDGIGGFPYLWEQLNGKGSCLWASEIEEFPIAVTKLRIGE